jgi:hypothetical protein
MGMFTETAIIDYRLTFAEQEKKTNFCFKFSFAANKRNFDVLVFRLQQTNRSCQFPLILENRSPGNFP